MSNDMNKSRRNFIIGSAVTTSTIAVQVPNIAKASENNKEIDYQPQFFTDAEWRFINSACERLIPREIAAGAIEAGVPEFIDKQMLTGYGDGELLYLEGPFYPNNPHELGYQLPYSPKQLYQKGISEINNDTQALYKKDFADLDEEEQIKYLQKLESGDVNFDKTLAYEFFKLLLQNTQQGYLSDPVYGGNKNMVGWKMVGFPGARADYMDWVEQYNVKYPYPPVSISGKRG